MISLPQQAGRLITHAKSPSVGVPTDITCPDIDAIADGETGLVAGPAGNPNEVSAL